MLEQERYKGASIKKPQGAESIRSVHTSAPSLSWSEHPIWKDNFPLVAIVLIYTLAVYGVAALFGVQGKVRLIFFYGWFAQITIVFSGLFLFLQILNKSFLKYFNARTLVGVLTVFLLSPVFNSLFVSYKQAITSIHPFSMDTRLMRLDYLLHFGHQPWQLFTFFLQHPPIIQALDNLYITWFIFLLSSCLWMGWTRRRQLRLCFFISALLIWILIGSGLATLFSSAGPCYYSKVVDSGPDPYVPLLKRLAEIDQENSLWAVGNQKSLWEAYQTGRWLPFGGISAMPSIHVAIAVLYALLAFNIRKWLGFIFCGYLLAMQIGAVILGWHYAVDGYLGAGMALAIWYAVKRFLITWCPGRTPL